MPRISFECPVSGGQCNHPNCSVKYCREKAAEAAEQLLQERQFEQVSPPPKVYEPPMKGRHRRR
jgi:hypothetical protein